MSRSDSTLRQVTLNRLVKATQALIEVPHLRFQSSQKDSVIAEKNKTIRKMADAHQITYELNKEYRTIIQEKDGKWRDCDKYAGTIEDQNKRLTFRAGFMQIGTPIIAIGVGALGFVGGYYLCKLMK